MVKRCCSGAVKGWIIGFVEQCNVGSCSVERQNGKVMLQWGGGCVE